MAVIFRSIGKSIGRNKGALAVSVRKRALQVPGQRLGVAMAKGMAENGGCLAKSAVVKASAGQLNGSKKALFQKMGMAGKKMAWFSLPVDNPGRGNLSPHISPQKTRKRSLGLAGKN